MKIQHNITIQMSGQFVRLTKVSLVLVGAMLLVPGLAVAIGTSGGNGDGGARVDKNFCMENNSGQEALDVHFKAWQKEDDRSINDWSIEVDCCSADISSSRTTQPPEYDSDDGNQHAVQVDCETASVPNGECCEIKVHFELTRSNMIRLDELDWTFNVPNDEEEAMEEEGAEWGCAEDAVGGPIPTVLAGSHQHTFTITNDDPLRSMRVKNLKFAQGISYLTSRAAIEALSLTSFFDGNVLLAPGGTITVNVLTPTAAEGQFLYAVWTQTSDADVLSALIAMQHEIENAAACAAPSIPIFPLPGLLALAIALLGGMGITVRRWNLASGT